MSAKSLRESDFTKLGLYRLRDSGHGSNSGITEWCVISDVSVENSFVKPCRMKTNQYMQIIMTGCLGVCCDMWFC